MYGIVRQKDFIKDKLTYMNNQLVKMWIQNEMSKINYRKQMGLILPVVADAKMELLRDFYDTFDLDKVR
jgi:hypothetical protein